LIPGSESPHSLPGGNIGVQNTENSVSSVVSVFKVKKTIGLGSDEFKRWLSLQYFNESGEAPTESALSSAIRVLAALADSEPIHQLYNRVAPDGAGGTWIDMSDETGRAIHVTKQGWDVEEAPPIFKHYSHMLPLPEPVRVSEEGLEPILKYVNVKDPGSMLLAAVTPITYFDPEVPHVVMMNHGARAQLH